MDFSVFVGVVAGVVACVFGGDGRVEHGCAGDGIAVVLGGFLGGDVALIEVIEDEVVDVGRVDVVHGVGESFEVDGESAVTAGSQEIGADGDGDETAGDGVGDVLIVDSGAEGDGDVGAYCLTEDVGEGEGDDVEGLSGEVHDLVVIGEEIAVVDDLEGVAEFVTEAAVVFFGEGGEPGVHRDGFVEHEACGVG